MANETNTLKCPVCGTALKDDICPQCGYGHLSFPTSVPRSIADFQVRRIEVMRDGVKYYVNQVHDANRETIAAQRLVEKLRTELGRANDTIKHQNETIISLNTRNGQLESDLKKEKEDNAVEKDKQNSKITDLQSVINLQSSEIASLKESLKDAQEKLIQLSETPTKTLKGVVIIEDIRHSTRAAFPVYEGVNTYGSNPDKDSHCQIKFIVRGFRFLPVHFSVRTSAKGLILAGEQGANIYQNGGLIKSGVYARQADTFMLDDKVRINITQI